MATEFVKWQPSLNPPEGPGKFRNTFRMMLQLEAGDYLDLANVIDGAENIKSAYVWRTKDGWELRVASYSGTYGMSVEAEELKEDNAIFDKVLVSCDIEPPFKDDKKCECGCGSPSKLAFLPKHELRDDARPEQVPAPAQEEVAPPEPEEPQLEEEVQEPEPEVEPEPQGEEIEPSDEPEDTTPDAALSPESAAAQPEESDGYAKYLAEKIVSAPEDAEEAGESEDDELLTQRRVDLAIDAMLKPNYSLAGDDRIAAEVAAIGIQDPYVNETAFLGYPECACGCGSPTSRRGAYLSGHEIRHREWLLREARRGDRRAYASLRGLGWLSWLHGDASPDYDPARVPAGLPVGAEAYAQFEMLDPGDGSVETKIGRLQSRRDSTNSPVLRALLNETIYRLRRGMDAAVDVRPSSNRSAVVDLAFRLAAADAGILFDDSPDYEEASPEGQSRLKEAWSNHLRRMQYMDEAQEMLDTASTDEPIVEIAGRMTTQILRRAIAAGVEEVPYEYRVVWPEGNLSFDPAKIAAGEDDERFALVVEPVYSKYRNWLEFSGEPFDPMAKFYNYLAMDIAAGKKPAWATGESDDPWIAAAQSLDADDEEFVAYWSQWWLTHGHKAAMYSPDPAFMLSAKNARDYAATKAIDSEALTLGSTRDVGLSAQATGSFLEGYLLNSPTNRGRAVFVVGSPFENDYFMTARRSQAVGVKIGENPSPRLEGWAKVRVSERANVTQAMLDAGALVKPASWDGAGLPDAESWADPEIDKAREGLSLFLPLGDGRAVEFVPDPTRKPSGLKDDVFGAVRSERGMMRFHRMTPSRIIRWLRDTFGVVVEPVVPYGYFYPNGRSEGVPNLPKDDYADGAVYPQFDEYGVVRPVLDINELSDVADSGAVVSLAGALRRGESVGSAAKGDVGSGLDEFVVCGFSAAGGQDFMKRAEAILVFRTDLVMNDGLLFATTDVGGSKDRFKKYDHSIEADWVANPARLDTLDSGNAEVAFPGEVNIEDLIAVVVPSGWMEDKKAMKVLVDIQNMNPSIEIHYSEGSYDVHRAVAKDLIIEYNRKHGFAGATRPKVSRGDVVVVSVPNQSNDLRYNNFVMKVNRTDSSRIFGSLYATPATEIWLEALAAGQPVASSEGQTWAESARTAGMLGEDSRPREVEIDRDHIIWLSKKLES